MSNFVSVVFFSFYSRLLSLHEIVLFEMVLHTIVQYYTLIFILNIVRRLGFFILEISRAYSRSFECDYCTQSSAQSFEKNVLIKKG